MFKNENQFSRTASQLSIDEAYTNFEYLDAFERRFSEGVQKLTPSYYLKNG